MVSTMRDEIRDALRRVPAWNISANAKKKISGNR